MRALRQNFYLKSDSLKCLKFYRKSIVRRQVIHKLSGVFTNKFIFTEVSMMI